MLSKNHLMMDKLPQILLPLTHSRSFLLYTCMSAICHCEDVK